MFAAAAAASVALLLFVPPIIYRPTDQNSSGSRLASAPVASVAPSVAPTAPVAVVAPVAAGAPVVPPVAAKAPVTPPVTSAVAPIPVKSVRTVRIQTKATPEEIAEAVRRGWRPTDQNSSGSRLALAPVVAPVAPEVSFLTRDLNTVLPRAKIARVAPLDEVLARVREAAAVQPAPSVAAVRLASALRWVPVAPLVAAGAPVAAVASAAPVVPVARAPLAPVAFVESAWKADSLLARPADITQAPPLLTWNVVRRGLHLLAQGQITDARQLLLHWESQGAERDAAVALSLGTSYDPIELEQLRSATASPNVVPDSFADIAMARTWYLKAKDLGSIEAERRLESLAALESQPRPSKQSEAVATVALESGTGADQNSTGSQVAVQSSPAPQSDPVASAPPIHGAVATLVEATKQGVPEAIWKLGRMYADGDGVETNRARAYEYFRRLIALRVTSATANNSSSAVTTAPANNRSSAPNARFLANAFVTLGLYHLEGIPGTLKADPNVAREMFRYAAFFRRLMSV